MQWFRYYHEALDDPKVQRCSSDAFRCWVNLLSLNCRCEGTLPPLSDVAFSLRLELSRLKELLTELDGLVTVRGDKITITNWDKRQYRSDNSTERSRKHRETKAQQECNVAATPPDTESDTETEIDKKVPTEPLSAKADETDEVYELWNEVAGEFDLPKARRTKGPTLKHVRLRLKEHGIEGWHNAINGIRGSPHHRGENDRGWRADLPWLSLPSNFEKLMMKGETYGDRGSPPPEQPHNRNLETSRGTLAEVFSPNAGPD